MADLSGIDWIPELEQCRRRVLVDVDPMFTQIGATGWASHFLDTTTCSPTVRTSINLQDDYDTHCRTARAVAKEYFDVRRVLTNLLERSL